MSGSELGEGFINFWHAIRARIALRALRAQVAVCLLQG